MKTKLGEICRHSLLKQQCQICELEIEHARLLMENEKLWELLQKSEDAIRDMELNFEQGKVGFNCDLIDEIDEMLKQKLEGK